MNVYKSCNCRHCRHASSARKGTHKREAHRNFRRVSKAMLRRGDDSTPIVSSGYPC